MDGKKDIAFLKYWSDDFYSEFGLIKQIKLLTYCITCKK